MTVVVGECKGKESVQVQVNWRCFCAKDELPAALWVRGCPGGASEVRSYAGFRLRSPSQPLGLRPLGLRWASKLHQDLLYSLPIRPFDAAAAISRPPTKQ